MRALQRRLRGWRRSSSTRASATATSWCGAAASWCRARRRTTSSTSRSPATFRAGRAEPLLRDVMQSAHEVLGPLRPGTDIWFWGEGTAPRLPRFAELRGLRGAVVAAVDLIRGIGVYAGMDVLRGRRGHRRPGHRLRRQGSRGGRGPGRLRVRLRPRRGARRGGSRWQREGEGARHRAGGRRGAGAAAGGAAAAGRHGAARPSHAAAHPHARGRAGAVRLRDARAVRPRGRGRPPTTRSRPPAPAWPCPAAPRSWTASWRRRREDLRPSDRTRAPAVRR